MAKRKAVKLTTKETVKHGAAEKTNPFADCDDALIFIAQARSIADLLASTLEALDPEERGRSRAQ